MYSYVARRSDEADDGAGGRGAADERELRQLPAAVRGRAAQGEGQARLRAARGARRQAAGARGEHGGDQEHALLHVQVRLRAQIQVHSLHCCNSGYVARLLGN